MDACAFGVDNAKAIQSELHSSCLPLTFYRYLAPSLGIMSHHLYLHLHILESEPNNAHTSPDRTMIRHPLFKVSDHGFQRGVVQWDMV